MLLGIAKLDLKFRFSFDLHMDLPNYQDSSFNKSHFNYI